jgi:hypothetical protein
MTITYPITFPTSALTVNGLRVRPRSAVARSESQFSLQDDVTDWGGQMWEISGSLPLMTREQAAAYVTFMLKLNGKKGTFLFPIPDATVRGIATGTPLVKGASQTGNSLIIDGFTNGVTGILKAGDWFNLGSGSSTRLHMVLDDVNSNGSGEVTVDIWPSLRESPSDNAAVTLTNCKLLARLKSDVGYDIDINKHYMLEFEAQEVV